MRDCEAGETCEAGVTCDRALIGQVQTRAALAVIVQGDHVCFGILTVPLHMGTCAYEQPDVQCPAERPMNHIFFFMTPSNWCTQGELQPRGVP